MSFVIERYLAILESLAMKTLKDLVEFNKKHAELELPPREFGHASSDVALTDASSTIKSADFKEWTVG